jgi:magnesium transporter
MPTRVSGFRVVTALLFDKDVAHELDGDWRGRVGRLARSQILWVDADTADAEIEPIAEAFELSAASRRRLETGMTEPYIGDFGHYLHVAVVAPRGGGATSAQREIAQIECLVGKNWVATVHSGPVDALDSFRDLAASSGGETGRLDALAFLATVLEWMLHAYLDTLEGVEERLEEFDSRAMEQRLDDVNEELRSLVELRRDVGRTRRGLASHRQVFAALAHPELEAVSGSNAAERFRVLSSRLEDAIQSTRDTREAIVGSFDVIIASTEHRTSQIVKTLTLVSILLLPGSLLAGVMGMNFRIGLFDTPAYFWVVVGLIALVALAALTVARARRWV